MSAFRQHFFYDYFKNQLYKIYKTIKNKTLDIKTFFKKY